jgi:hypothetical protein
MDELIASTTPAQPAVPVVAVPAAAVLAAPVAPVVAVPAPAVLAAPVVPVVASPAASAAGSRRFHALLLELFRRARRHALNAFRLAVFTTGWGYERQIARSFERRVGYRPKLENPQTFNEKIQWLKLHGGLERYAPYVDKYEVRAFIAERAGPDCLIPLLGIYDTTRAVDWATLPESFVIKATHGSKWNIIVKSKREADWTALQKTVKRWLRTNYYHVRGEPNYRPLKGRFMIEEYLEDPTGDLKDYKFFCFNGEPMFVQVDGTRHTDHRRDVYDLDWNRLPVRLHCENLKQAAEKPARLPEMVAISRRIAADFPFVRVDLYHSREQIYFGELTFTPNNGMRRFVPLEYDYRFGALLDLRRYAG